MCKSREIIVTIHEDMPDVPFYKGEEIVRCRDCERYVPKHRRCEWTWLDRRPNDFCSRGERKSDG